MNINKKIIREKNFTGRLTGAIIILMILSLTVTLMAGCGSPESDTSGEDIIVEPEEEAPAEVDRSAEIKNEFDKIDKTNENIGVIFNFINENIADSNPELSSDMVHTVIKLCEDYRPVFAEKISDPDISGTIFALSSEVIVDGVLVLEALRDINNEKVRDVIDEAINKRYKLITIEGMIEPIVDYRAYDIYMPYLGEEMKDYLCIKIDESEKPTVMDAEVTITPDDFVARIIKSMEYLGNYPHSPRYDEIDNLKDRMLWIYLGGVDNSPVFGPDGKILTGKLGEFENMLERYPGTGFADILASYLELLEEENYTRTEKVKDFIDDLYEI